MIYLIIIYSLFFAWVVYSVNTAPTYDEETKQFIYGRKSRTKKKRQRIEP